MDEDELLAASTDPLLTCRMCNRLLCDAVQLKCLHNYCLQCFRTVASTAGSEGISCSACGLRTQHGSEQPNGFIDGQVRWYRVMAESRMCGVCKGNGERDKPALVWCKACQHSLCGECVSGHRQYNRQHVTQSLEDLNSLDEVYKQPTASACAIHKKPLDIACLNCEQAKCISCWAECNEKKHEMRVVGKESFDSYVGGFISSIASVECELLRKSEVLHKQKSVLHDAKSERDRHLEEICARKQRIVEAVETTYQEIEIATRRAYEKLEAERIATATLADRIDADLSYARNYIRRLVESNEKCEILNQQKIVRERLSGLSAELDSLSDLLTTTTTEVTIEASLPADVENVVREWIGMPRGYAASSSLAASGPQVLQQERQQQQQQPEQQQQEEQQKQQEQHVSSHPTSQQQQQQQSFAFGAASARFQLPVQCQDIAVTLDRRSLLLAAWQRGLIELSSANGDELSRWQPPKHMCSSSMGVDDPVLAVAALSDGRAAVSLHFAQLVVLLRRNEKNSDSSSSNAAGGRPAAALAAADADDNAWTEVRRIQLPWPRPNVSANLQLECHLRMSAYGDVLATSYDKSLQLLSLSSGQPLSVAMLQCEYSISSLAVAARVVVIGSSSKVELGSGRRAAHVLDAHSLADADGSRSYKRLWRHVLCSCCTSEQEEEELCCVCPDSSGGCLYAAVWRKDNSSGPEAAPCFGGILGTSVLSNGIRFGGNIPSSSSGRMSMPSFAYGKSSGPGAAPSAGGGFSFGTVPSSGPGAAPRAGGGILFGTVPSSALPVPVSTLPSGTSIAGSSLGASMPSSSRGRVSVLSLADGSELRRVALSFDSGALAIAAYQPLLTPMRLSLCYDRAAAEEQQSNCSNYCSGCRVLPLAVLLSDQRTVMLHRSVN